MLLRISLSALYHQRVFMRNLASLETERVCFIANCGTRRLG